MTLISWSPNNNLALISQNPNNNLATIFLKFQIIIWHLSHEAQMLIWHNSTKSKYYLGNYFTKPKILFWQEKQLLYTQSPNTILTHTYKTQILFLTLAKSPTYGKYNYSSLKKYLSYKIYESPCASSMAKLLIL